MDKSAKKTKKTKKQKKQINTNIDSEDKDIQS
jgi:hypothetical protein